MKMLFCGDLHLMTKTPKNRTDDIRETSLRKLRFLLQTAEEKKVKFILQPGDFTDSPLLTWSFFNEIIEEINKSPIEIVTTWGQHDLLYRTKGNTALDSIACSCPRLHLLNKDTEFAPEEKEIGIHIFSSAFGEELPIISEEASLNILITHRMVIDKKLWESQEHFEYGKTLLEETDFDIIVSGDNHQHFVIDQKRKKKILFNCGSMIRTKIDQLLHKPAFYIFDTETFIYEKIFFPIQPPEEVFYIDAVEEKKEADIKMEAFKAKLKEQKAIGLKFETNMMNYLSAQDTLREQVKSLIYEGMKEEVK